MRILKFILPIFLLSLFTGVSLAGPYTEAGIPAYIGNEINPIFKGWATGYVNYLPTPSAESSWRTPELALGPPGETYPASPHFDVVSLGDLDQAQIDAWLSDPENNQGPGEITMTFDKPIINGDGYDFAVFENGFFVYPPTMPPKGFFELAWVDVSTDGEYYARFKGMSITPHPGVTYYPYLPTDPTDVYYFAGKHANSYDGPFEGTGFDLEDLTDDPMVISGYVDLNNINYVRIVDIPGNGDFDDSLGNPIIDPWFTWALSSTPDDNSSGFDLEAVGVINQYEPPASVPGPTWLLVPTAGILIFMGRRSFLNLYRRSY